MGRLLLFFVIFQSVYCSCPSGLELVRDGECRGLYTTAMASDITVTNASISKCKEIRGQAVIIHNEEHYAYWTSFPTGYYVMGLICNTNSKLWEWADGSSVDFKPTAGKYGAELDIACRTGCSWWGYSDGHWSLFCDTTTGTINIYCTTQIEMPVQSDDGCESFDDDSEDGVCYQIGAPAETFKESQIICRSFGADLASIHNKKENDFIRRLAVSRQQVTGLFLGATVSGKGNDFAWTDGSEWDYQNLYSGFPMNGLGDCLMMDTESSSGQWANVDCSTKLSVTCQRQQHYPTPACSDGPYVEGQIIYSPGFPFDASTPCDFILSVDSGKKVEAEILLLEANSCCDQLVLFENYFGGTVIANLTGELSNKMYKTSSSNFMRVSWRPTDGVNVRGMMMTFRGV